MLDGLLERPTVAVPFVDLSHSHQELKESILAAIADLIDSQAYINGPQVREFEEAFAAYCERTFCVGLASGADALRLSLVAAGIAPGDEVLLPANTFAATAVAVVQAGGRPVIADVTERDYNIDPAAVEAAITPRARFMLPVHLYGQLADMRALAEIAERFRLTVVEDACQAHGAVRDGMRAGAAGDMGAFSFYPSKNLGAMGDGGALVTNDENVAGRLRALREHGQTRKNHHELLGCTARLDTIQATVLLQKLPLLDRWNESRREAARFYTEALAGVGDVDPPPVPAGSSPVWHLYPIRTAHSLHLETFLRERGIGTGRHYPQPVHLMPVFADLGYEEGSRPVAEALARELLTLPIFPGISREQLEAVVGAVRDFFAGR